MMERQYKDSGIEWIGRIPEGWETCQLKRLLSFRNGQDYKLVESETGYPVYGSGGIFVHASEYLYDGEAVLFGRKGTIDRPIYVNEKFWTVDTMYYAIPLSTGDGKFVYYLGTLLPFNKYQTSTALPSMTQTILGDMKVILPPLPEQQRIASYLDKKCEEIDELIALQEKMIEQLTEYKQAVITEAVTKGLDPNAKLVPSGIEWIGDVPEGWKVVPIKFLKSSVKNAFVDGPFGSNLKSEHFIVEGDILVIESGFITTGKFIFKEFKTISSEHFETIRRSECRAHDVIIAKIGANYGMASELPELGKPAVVSGNSLKITLDNSKILNSIFVYLMMTSKHNHGFIDLVQENAQPALSLSGLNNFKLPVPPLPEQHSIASYLDTKCSEIDSLIALKRQKIESLNAYKKSVIYEAVTGKTIIE